MSLLQDNKIFFNKIAKHYDNFLGIWLNKILRKLVKEVKIKNNSAVLDAGCGTGNFLKLLSENKTLGLCGIDISPKMLEIAKGRLKNKAELNLIPVEEINYKNKFEYIFSTEAFHHYSDQDLAMKNFALALKKKGKLIVTDLNFGRILNWIFHKLEPGNRKMNSKREFYKLFNRHGFKNIRQKRLGWFAVMSAGEKETQINPKHLNS